jgi:hypothetical protein
VRPGQITGLATRMARQAAAPLGTGTPGTVAYGLNLQAWCVFLIAAHAIPVHRC